ncbi:MAG: Asp-tRNA(Asn)/Glu-tRNA(Gln) amidotransferase subunit GatC [Holosporales bacterium]|jgi:aspartyl-tRNA(Asn)/glutamyl-tRNA(Gln) amidotransferase subunit C|nr:Asp-tRNA(Asn)/Glu-tRNA(Gln) amidotransferase subunit GatC [Holosporales bacterium]
MDIVTKEEMRKVAMLARVRVEEEELEPMAQELSQVLAFVRKLDALQGIVDTIPLQSEQQTPLRPDEVHLENTVEELLANAPKTAFGMFAVPKVME